MNTDIKVQDEQGWYTVTVTHYTVSKTGTLTIERTRKGRKVKLKFAKGAWRLATDWSFQW